MLSIIKQWRLVKRRNSKASPTLGRSSMAVIRRKLKILHRNYSFDVNGVSVILVESNDWTPFKGLLIYISIQGGMYGISMEFRNNEDLNY